MDIYNSVSAEPAAFIMWVDSFILMMEAAHFSEMSAHI
jgi:hypothetical protein